MTRMHPQELREGMILARSIFAEDGRVLLRGGAKLRSSYVTRLRQMGIPAVYVLDPGEVYQESDIVSEQTRSVAVAEVRRAFNAVAVGRSINLRAIHESVDTVLHEILSTRSPVLGLSEIRASDSYTYCHSVNVCIVSLLLGIQCGLSMMDLRLLGVGAILHDIGKIHVPHEILNKSGPLTREEMAVMQGHTKWGFDHLRVYRDLNLLSSLVAYQHHERLDGSGYPQGLREEKIHRYSRFVMVADVYDAMTADRVYRKAATPTEALSHIQSMRGISFPSEVVDALARVVGPYPCGARVLLNTGELARVIDVNPMLLERPKVRVLQAPYINRLSAPFDIDLQRDISRKITKVIYD